MAKMIYEPSCEYCGEHKEQLELVNLTKHVTVLVCNHCDSVIRQVSKYPRIALILTKGGNND